jgi:hypothetical protein
MVRDRVRRTWGRGGATQPWLIHPAALFALLLFDVWLKSEGIYPILATARGGHALLLTPGYGGLDLQALVRMRWILAAIYLLGCAVGLLLELWPVRLDPAPWRPAALGASLLGLAGASLLLMDLWSGPTPAAFVRDAEADFDAGDDTESYRFAVEADLAGARRSCRERLDHSDPALRAHAAVVLLGAGERDGDVLRALRSGGDEMARALDAYRGDRPAYRRFMMVRRLLDHPDRGPIPGYPWLVFCCDRQDARELAAWWRGIRSRFEDPR